MIGSNSLVLNEATMIEALQYWLTNKVLNKDELAPKVTGISTNNYGEFKVSVVQEAV